MKITWNDVADIALGGAFLACGGGGDVLVGRMVTERVLREHGDVDLIPLHEITDDAMVIAVGGVGAPSIMNEKVSNGTEAITALRLLEEYAGRKADALIAFEAGGFNSLIPGNACLTAEVTGTRCGWHGSRLSRNANGDIQYLRCLCNTSYPGR